MSRQIAIILKGYPRLSETFIAQELLGLEQAGLKLQLISMRHPIDVKRHPVHDEIKAPVTYLPEYLHDEPLRVVKAWWQCRRRVGYRKALRAWLSDLKSDMSRNRFRRFGQALVFANELPREIEHLHAHFIHTPASVALYTSLLTGLPWTCSAHAKDIWTSREGELRCKLSTARWVVTCTRAGWQYLRSLAVDSGIVHLSYHGLDLSRFDRSKEKHSSRDGTDASDPVRLLTVCRAVDKKGLDILVDALAMLPRDVNWHLTHIGGGDLVEGLRKRAASNGLADRIDWAGPQDQSTVLKAYRQADLFVLPCRIAADGDRDGLPNVMMEAQSQGVCCLSTNISGVPELIDDGQTGCLVEPEDSDALAEALAKLIAAPGVRAELGLAGEKKVRNQFDVRSSIATLQDLFETVRPAGSATPQEQAGP